MGAIWLYSLQEWGAEQTDRYIDDLTAAFAFLADSPKAGAQCENIRAGYRKYPVILLPIVLPAEGRMPEGWRSAVWYALGASGGNVLIKVYASLECGGPELRWRRIGRALLELGRRRSLERLCDMSSSVSGRSWPVGLAFDILPDGSPGRIKAYFKAGAVGPSWLARWYATAGLPDEIDAVRTALEAFPWHRDRPYWPGSLFVSAEFDALENLTLKTDLAVSRWVVSDARVVQGVRKLADSLGLKDAGYLRSLRQLDDWPPNASETRTHHVVGIGCEENGERHINVYCQPAIRTMAETHARPGSEAAVPMTRRQGLGLGTKQT